MIPQAVVARTAAIAVVLLAATTSACASARRSPAQTASLNDPRMTCARTELTKLGYTVDESIRRPGRFIATRNFPIVRVHRVAIMAEVDSTDHAFEIWARALPRDDGISVADVRAQPPVSMLGDAMEVQNVCEEKK